MARRRAALQIPLIACGLLCLLPSSVAVACPALTTDALAGGQDLADCSCVGGYSGAPRCDGNPARSPWPPPPLAAEQAGLTHAPHLHHPHHTPPEACVGPSKCSSGKVCLGYEPETGHVFCYGSNGGCKWNQNDCATDSDCSKYTTSSNKYTDGMTCPGATGWAAEACACHPSCETLFIAAPAIAA